MINPIIYIITSVTFFLKNMQIIEPFTAHYVFALGIARFLACAHWLIQVKFKGSYVRNHLASVIIKFKRLMV